MEQRFIDELEAGVERLLAAYGMVKEENRQLKERLSAVEDRQDIFKQRLDSLLEKLAEVDLK